VLRSAQEKARAKQRLLAARQQWRQQHDHLPNRPIWQAMKDSPLRTGELR
jgi:hypothetical protein